MSTSLYRTPLDSHSVPDAAVCGTECCLIDLPLDILVATDFHQRPMNMPVLVALACKSDLPALEKAVLHPLGMRFRLFLHEQICGRDPTGAYSKREVTANLPRWAFLRPFADSARITLLGKWRGGERGAAAGIGEARYFLGPMNRSPLK